MNEEELIKIDLEDIKTLEEAVKVIQKIRDDGGSMKPFTFELNKEIQKIMLDQSSEKGTFFGVPFITVDRIDKVKVKEVIDKHLKRMRETYSNLIRAFWTDKIGPEGIVARESIDLECELKKELGL